MQKSGFGFSDRINPNPDFGLIRKQNPNNPVDSDFSGSDYPKKSSGFGQKMTCFRIIRSDKTTKSNFFSDNPIGSDYPKKLDLVVLQRGSIPITMVD